MIYANNTFWRSMRIPEGLHGSLGGVWGSLGGPKSPSGIPPFTFQGSERDIFAAFDRPPEGKVPAPSDVSHRLDGLQADVGRLCQQLQDRRRTARRHAIQRELSQLLVCHESLFCLLQTTRQRREDLAYEIWATQRGDTPAPVMPEGETSDPTDGAKPLPVLDVASVSCSCQSLRAVYGTPNGLSADGEQPAEAIRRKIKK